MLGGPAAADFGDGQGDLSEVVEPGLILDLIGGIETEEGLPVTACLDERDHPTGIKITDTESAAAPIDPHEWHSTWNYTINPA